MEEVTMKMLSLLAALFAFIMSTSFAFADDNTNATSSSPSTATHPMKAKHGRCIHKKQNQNKQNDQNSDQNSN